MKADKTATTIHRVKINPRSPLIENFSILRVTQFIAPVRAKPALITNIEAIIPVAGFAKPLRAWEESIKLKTSRTTSTPIAIKSTRNLPDMKKAIIRKTIIRQDIISILGIINLTT
jgi:hypothetical protein